MDYGLYIAASGVSADMAQIDVRANNLANAQTPGFRTILLSTQFRQAVREEDHLPFADSNAMLERLGGGVEPAPTRVTTTQGPLETTGRPLDVGIAGSGWLTVAGANGSTTPRLTRDGRMAIDAQGTLVQSTSGAPVLDDSGSPITVDPSAPVTIRFDGMVEQGEVRRGRLGIVDVAEAFKLVTIGSGLMGFSSPDQALSAAPSTGSTVHQGSVEQSSVDPVKELMTLTSAGSSAQRNMRLIGLIAQNMELAVSRLGRVA